MGGQAAHISNAKEAHGSEAHAQLPAREIAASGPQADMLDLQHDAGNWAVSGLVDAEKSKNTLFGDVSQGKFQASNNSQIPVHPVQAIAEAGANWEPGHSLQGSLDRPAPQPEVLVPPPTKVSTDGGRALDHSTLREMNAAFGTDFSHVRLHTDIAAQQRTMLADASALTEGTHIYLGPQYRQGTAHGRSLLARELTNVRQQSPGPIGISERGRDALEDEAREVGERVPIGGKAGAVAAGTAPHGVPQADAERPKRKWWTPIKRQTLPPRTLPSPRDEGCPLSRDCPVWATDGPPRELINTARQKKTLHFLGLLVSPDGFDPSTL